MIDFTKYLYESLPPIYALEDEYQGRVLKRYLDVLGFAMNILCNETEDIRKLYDVDHMPMEFLQRYASIFDFPIYSEMPEYLQRKMLSNIVPILRRKGTAEVIEFIAREVTGCDIEVIEGDSTVFATWAYSSNMPIGYEMPTTFDPIVHKHYRYGGDGATDRFTIYVEVISSLVGGITEEELKEKEDALRLYLKDLIPSYLNLIFRVAIHTEYEDPVEETINVTATDYATDKLIDSDTYTGKSKYAWSDAIVDSANEERVHLEVVEAVGVTTVSSADEEPENALIVATQHVLDDIIIEINEEE